MSAPTIKDIARETGLSSATISKFINGGNVRPANREAIQNAIKKLGFHPNEAARVIRGVPRRTVAVVIPSVAVDYCRTFFLAVQQYLIQYDYASILLNYNNNTYHENRAVSTALSNHIDGFISLPLDADADCYGRIRDSGVPLVFVHANTYPDVHNILLDDQHALAEIAAEICGAEHTRIGLISSLTERHVADSHIELIKTQFRTYNCSIPNELIYTSNAATVSAGYEGFEYMLSLDEPPSAIIALNSELLLGAKIAAMEHGLRIPEDISLAGTTECTMTSSPALRNITSICYPMTHVAEEAVRIVMKNIDDNRKNIPVEHLIAGLTAKVHWGRSIGPRKQ